MRLDLGLSLLHGLHQSEQRGESLCCASRIGIVGSDLLDTQMDRAKIAQAGDEGRVLRHRQLQAKDADEATIREGKTNVTESPDTRESGHVAVTRRQQRRA